MLSKPLKKSRLERGGLSLSHDFHTSVTTAFIVTELVGGTYDSRHFVSESLFSQLWKMIGDASQHCDHPTFLPTALLCSHIQRLTDHCIWHCGKELHELEDRVGFTRIGVLAKDPARRFVVDKTVKQAKEMSSNYLVDLSCRLMDTVFTIRLSEWDKECVSFLIQSTQDISKVTNQRLKDASDSILDMLRYLNPASKNLLDCNNAHRSRVQLQLDAVSLRPSKSACAYI